MAFCSIYAKRRGRSRPRRPLDPPPPGPIQRCLFCGARPREMRQTCWACRGSLFVWGVDGDKDCFYTLSGDEVLKEFIQRSATEADAWIALVIELEQEKLRDRIEEPPMEGWLHTAYAVPDEGGLPPVALNTVKVDDDECFWSFRK